MVVKNITKGTIITKNLMVANSLIDRTFGLLKQDEPKSLLLYTRFGIHTFILKKPIDVLVIENSGKIAIAKTIKPNRILIYNPIYKTVLELPENTITKSKSEKEDKVKIF